MIFCCCSSVILDAQLQIDNKNRMKQSQQQQSEQKDWVIYVDWSLCCCYCCCVLLLLFICNCACTMTDEQQQQQNYTVGTTTLRTKRSIYIHILCNFQGLNGGGRWELDIPCSDVPPGRGIWWPRAVLCKVIMTLDYALGHADIQSDVPC